MRVKHLRLEFPEMGEMNYLDIRESVIENRAALIRIIDMFYHLNVEAKLSGKGIEDAKYPKWREIDHLFGLSDEKARVMFKAAYEIELIYGTYDNQSLDEFGIVSSIMFDKLCEKNGVEELVRMYLD